MKQNNNNNWLGWANLTVMILLAILGYFFVQKNTDQLAHYNSEIAKIDLATRWQHNMNTLAESLAKTEESRANAVLAGLNANLARLESEVKGVRDKLDITQKQTQIVAVLGELVGTLKPMLEVTTVKASGNDKKEMVLEYQIANRGKYTAIVERPRIFITTEDPQEMTVVRSELAAGEFYTLGPMNRPGEVYPVSTRLFRVSIFPVKPLPDNYYIYAIFEARTPEYVAGALAPFLAGLVKKEDLAVLSRTTSATTFTIRLKQ